MAELKLWDIRWAVDESMGLYRMLRSVPTPELLSYWITGQSIGNDYCTYMGVIAAPNETEAIQILLRNVQPVTEISWVRPYVMSQDMQSDFDRYVLRYNVQRVIYFESLGVLYDKPVVSHLIYGDWKCITLTELF